ncbi:hypothetical protein HMPREF9144_0597 [Prevotella pallens ATCC 700821]|uniref:Uncharacterized protein n=1 Tax=Prevotella pallens ATCC 700821 TaxID=997353 RepID=F9DG07_9BACT|nr:hypothetical protein HMPREF9144_0597 [Prevotella pallens ATCC 700821]
MLIISYTNRTIRNMNIIRTDNGYCYLSSSFRFIINKNKFLE